MSDCSTPLHWVVGLELLDPKQGETGSEHIADLAAFRPDFERLEKERGNGQCHSQVSTEATQNIINSKKYFLQCKLYNAYITCV